MKKAVLSLALLFSVQLGMPGVARADDSEGMSLSLAGDMDMDDMDMNTDHDLTPACDGDRGGRGGWDNGRGGRREGYWGGGGGRDGWDGGRGGYGRGSWTCVAQNNYGSAFSAVAYDMSQARNQAIQDCNRYTVFGNCYISSCY